MTDASPRVVVVGDGPTGLSAALFLAKCKASVDVVGPDETAVHKAFLHNYLGAPDMPGPDFVQTARQQAERHGARLRKDAATAIHSNGDGFKVTTRGGATLECDYVVLANGRDPALAEALGMEKGPHGIRVDLNGRSSVPRAYAGGWLTRGPKIQAAISVGDGAAIAIDILSEVKGKPFHDFDVMPAPARAPASSAPPAARHAGPQESAIGPAETP